MIWRIVLANSIPLLLKIGYDAWKKYQAKREKEESRVQEKKNPNP